MSLLDSILDRPPRAETPEANSPIVQSPSPPDAGAGAVDALLARRRGRHPKGCTCGNCVQSNPALRAASRKPSVAAIEQVTEVDRALARQAIKALTHTADSVAILVIDMRLRAISADSVTREMAEKAMIMPDQTRDGICVSGTAVAEKYGVVKCAPEIALGIYLTTWLTGILAVLVKLGKVAPKENEDNKPEA